MARLKITRELHAEVCETLKTTGVMSTARHHNLSPKTVSRIKRGRSYVGYKRVMASDHDSEQFYLDIPPPPPRESRWPKFLDRFGLRG